MKTIGFETDRVTSKNLKLQITFIKYPNKCIDHLERNALPPR